MIRWFAKHPVAPNLLLLLILALAIVYVPLVQRTTFPEIPDRRINVSVSWSGASANEIIDAICKPIEQKLEGISEMDRYNCEAEEGFASLRAMMDWGGNYDDFYDDVESAVAQAKLPAEADTPTVTKAQSGMETFVANVTITGFKRQEDLKAYAEQFEDKLKRQTSITETSLSGFSDLKYYVELKPEKLKALNLSVDEVAKILSNQSIDASLGTLESVQVDYRLKVENRKTSITELQNTYLTSFSDGGILTLGDIADIYAGFEDTNPKTIFNGKTAATITVWRTTSQDILKLADELYTYIDQAQQTLPKDVTLDITADASELTGGRLKMVIKNGIMGIILAFLTLWLFFNIKYSFWITIGLPLSFAGGLVIMYFYGGMTINLMSLAGLLIAIGILMDDAIVVAENIHAHHQMGKSKINAAIDGAKEVVPGVVSSFLTTIMIAFTISFLEGQIGVILAAVPMAIIFVLIVSLIEAFLILPAHLSHSLRDKGKQQPKIRRAFYEKFNYLRDHVVYPMAQRSVKLKWLSLLLLVVIFISGPAALSFKLVKRTNFPAVESNTVDARILYASGTKFETTQQGVDHIVVKLHETIKQYQEQYLNAPKLLESYTIFYGKNPDSSDNGDHQATISVDLNEEREITSEDFSALWTENVGVMADVTALNILPDSIGPGGDSISLRVMSDDEDAIIRVSLALEAFLQEIEGTRAVLHDLRAGIPEWKFTLTPLALNLGVTARDIAFQIRSDIYGNIVDELQVGDDTVEISLRYGDEAARSLNLLEDITIKIPSGENVPLQELVDLKLGSSPTRIYRSNGSLVNTVRSSVNEEVMLETEIEDMVKNTFIPKMRQEEPDVTISFGGRREDTARALGSLGKGALLGLFGIYIILALQFRSWLQPLSVMLVMPLGFTGAIWGHFLLGFNFSMPSILGAILMLGIAVNDSILLVTFIRRRLDQGDPLRKAAAMASKERFRAVFLTSVTTVAGVLPLLLETDIQAQVIQPIAISIAFGLIMTTLMVLFFVPVIYVTIEETKTYVQNIGKLTYKKLFN